MESCGSVIIITTYSEILHKHIETQYEQLCLVEDSISFAREYYDDYIKRSYFRPTVWLWCYQVTNVQNQKLKTTLDQTEDKQLKRLDPLLIITFSATFHEICTLAVFLKVNFPGCKPLNRRIKLMLKPCHAPVELVFQLATGYCRFSRLWMSNN